ncbi:MAG: Ni/Fe-hydrogenase, b-type cytochrome subunit [Nitrospirae bacterium]|nr:Ni/Fe-hydrogenase, b-type cytochrome subunit [Nitrospirota bacterium]MCL5238577.1 Ni/Fe-hydrogenase, b-type cytochrome subunit [Nitrospirota bacterium]
MQRRLYVWEFPVRLTHWITVVCIAGLSITGFYIGSPFIHATSADQYVMGWMRFIHFVAAYLLTASVLVRTYWSFVGNEYAHIREFFYFTPQRFVDLAGDLRYYIFMNKNQPRSAGGHSALASIVYLGVWILLFVEIFTGFALYSQSHYGGALWTLMGGWLLFLFSAQTVRLYHHLIMWVIIFFIIEHVYISWITREERGGFVDSMISGYRMLKER